jgi:hypothetical protein
MGRDKIGILDTVSYYILISVTIPSLVLCSSPSHLIATDKITKQLNLIISAV